MESEKAVQRYRSEQTKYETYSNTLEKKREKAQKIEKEIDEKQGQIDDLTKSIEVIKELVDILFDQSMQSYIDLVDRGLNTVFYDTDYEIDIDLDSRGRNKTAQIKYRKRENDTWTDWFDVDHGSGGSIRTVIDLITRVYLISVTDRKRFIAFDEKLSELDSKYSESMVDFLKSLTDEMGFDFIFVTHDDRYIDHAEKVYRMNQGNLSNVSSDLEKE